jgi:hypothetical protein
VIAHPKTTHAPSIHHATSIAPPSGPKTTTKGAHPPKIDKTTLVNKPTHIDKPTPVTLAHIGKPATDHKFATGNTHGTIATPQATMTSHIAPPVSPVVIALP